MSDLYHLLRLSSVPGIGQFRMRKLIAGFGTAEKVFSASADQLCSIDSIDQKTARAIRNQKSETFAEQQLEKAEKLNIQIISLWDDAYPTLLKNIYDPPCLLFVRGDPGYAVTPCLGVVGMRACSQYGQTAAKRLSEELAQAGITVVSGMARGIDTFAHRGALSGGGKTIGVLGCGPDVVYPPENVALYNKIIENGCIISEFPISTEPKGGFFPRRNRIISGISSGILVVEAGKKSGALITAYMALDQGREVFAVPGLIQSMKSRGTHQLLRQGATLVENSSDIQAELPQLFKFSAGSENTGTPAIELTDAEKKVWDSLGSDPVHIDELAAGCGKSISEVLALLLSMELKGCVNQSIGKMFTRRM